MEMKKLRRESEAREGQQVTNPYTPTLGLVGNPGLYQKGPHQLFLFYITLKPRVERYKSLRALNTSPPRNRCHQPSR